MQFDLSNVSLLTGFDASELAQIEKIIQPRLYPAGADVFTEGETGGELFLVASGEVEVIKQGKVEPQSVAAIGANGYFGELSFLDNLPRSTTIRVVSDCQVYVLNKNALNAQHNGVRLMNKLYQNIATQNAQRLRMATQQVVELSQKDMVSRQFCENIQQFSILLLLSFIFVLAGNTLLDYSATGLNPYSIEFSWNYLLILFLPSLRYVLKSELPISDFGVSLTNWKTALFEGVVIAITGVAVLCLLIMGLGYLGYIEVGIYAPLHLVKQLSVYDLSYLLHCYTAEFIIRGVIFTRMLHFLSSLSLFKVVLLSSALTAFFYLPYGPLAIIIAFLFSIPLSLIFIRHNNLFGVSIIHFVLGSFVLAVMQANA